MTYAESIQFLYGLRRFGAKLGLENALRLAALAGDPQRQLQFIHVAGTNGKGSTCAILESIYRAADWRVGLFTSPHLRSFRERIQCNRQPISAEDVARLISGLSVHLEVFPAPQHPTFFEVVTVLALQYFAEQQCDLVIWETGLGGRLDATNIVTPSASVITSINLDHQEWLGNTLDQIAAEKAGIIKPFIPVVTVARPGGGLEVVQATADRQRAPLTVVNNPERVLSAVGGAVSLAGPYQRENAAVALATVGVLEDRWPVNQRAREEGLRQVRWPGRFQVVNQPGGQTIVLDGAHNPAGALALSEAWQDKFPGIQPALVLGFLSDKDWAAMARVLLPLGRRALLVPVSSARGLSPQQLALESHRIRPGLEMEIYPSLRAALQNTARDPFVLIAGSLYLIGEAMGHLGLAAAAGADADELGLNEWSGLRAERAAAAG